MFLLHTDSLVIQARRICVKFRGGKLLDLCSQGCAEFARNLCLKFLEDCEVLRVTLKLWMRMKATNLRHLPRQQFSCPVTSFDTFRIFVSHHMTPSRLYLLPAKHTLFGVPFKGSACEKIEKKETTQSSPRSSCLSDQHPMSPKREAESSRRCTVVSMISVDERR